MEALIDYIPPRNVQFLSPGNVGPVGDVLVTTRLRQSAPDMAMRYQDSETEQMMMGSNVQDGDSFSYMSGGRNAETIPPPNDTFLRQIGWRKMDLYAEDRMKVPKQGSLGNYNWKNKLASTIEGLELSPHSTGALFNPLPGEYRPTSITRGSQLPRLIASVGDESQYTAIGDQTQKSVVEKTKPGVTPEGISRTIVGALCTRRDGTRQRKPIPGRGA